MGAVTVHDPAQPSSSTSTVPTLPIFPDPSALWTQPGPSSLFILQEAQAHLAQIRDLRKSIINSPGNYTLGSGPASSALPPLPPIPNLAAIQPSSPSLSSASSKGRPDERPSIPSSLKGKAKEGEDGHGVRDDLLAFEETNPGWKGEERYAGRLVLCHRDSVSGRKGTAVWAMMKHDRRVGSVKVFLNVSGDIPDMSSPGYHIGLSNHLTALNLTLPELLFRIPHLDGLVRQACFYCTKYIKVPDGMPVQHTGYIGPSGSTKAKTKRQGPGSGDDKPGMSAQLAQDTDDVETEVGRWVCWHATCGEQ